MLRHLDADGNAIEFDHELAENREVITNRLGGSRTLEYDPRGNVTLEIDESGVATTRTFDINDQLLTETDALGQTTTYTYDAGRNLTSTTDPLGNVSRFTYDAKGNVLTATDPRGGVTRQQLRRAVKPPRRPSPGQPHELRLQPGRAAADRDRCPGRDDDHGMGFYRASR